MMTAVALDESAPGAIHLVTEQELPQYEEYVISKFELRSFTVRTLAILQRQSACMDRHQARTHAGGVRTNPLF